MYTGTLVEFLNMGGGEIMLILVVVLLLFGGKKLPELARGLGKGMRDFKDASEGVKREIHRNINSVGITDEINDFKSALSGEDSPGKHNYDYKPGVDPYNKDSYDGGSGYNHDEAAHHNSTLPDDVKVAEDLARADHAAHIEGTEQVVKSSGTELTDKKENT